MKTNLQQDQQELQDKFDAYNCPTCGAYGFDLDCPLCLGFGEIETEVGDWPTCPNCNGDGIIAGQAECPNGHTWEIGEIELTNERWIIVLHPDPPYRLHEFERCHPSRAQEIKEAYEGEGRGWLIFIQIGNAEFDRDGATVRLKQLEDDEVRRQLVKGRK